MYEVSQAKMIYLLSFSAIGTNVALILIAYLIYSGIKSTREHFRKNCYQCGDDIDRTFKVGDGYYCKFCIDAGNAEKNTEPKSEEREC